LTLGEATNFLTFTGLSLLGGGLLWILYIALEPFVRRRWPQMLVSWTRLLAENLRDPLVARDALIGCALGSLVFSLDLFSRHFFFLVVRLYGIHVQSNLSVFSTAMELGLFRVSALLVSSL